MLRTTCARAASVPLLVLVTACDGGSAPIATPIYHPFDTSEVLATSNYEVLVRFPSGPANIATQPSNNNLDVVSFGGRTFLAWRTAPTHFASSDTKILIASEGPDGWRSEGEFSLGTDLREPRFMAMGDRLFLYFAMLGTDPTAFQPQGTMVTEYVGQGTWGTPTKLALGDFIPWRARGNANGGVIVGYDGGENIYDFNGQPIEIRYLTTTDGVTMTPLWPATPVALSGGSSETDFATLDDGTVVSVSRNEAGDDEHGFGSVICRAEASAPGSFHCNTDKRKFDSPLVFQNGDDIYLVARRNMTPSGDYDLGLGLLPLEAQATTYEVAYSSTPKRCSIWKVDPDALTVTWLQDLPSRGDTCFPSMIMGDHKVTLYNYTSPLADALDCPSWPNTCADPSWIEGQLFPTEIYRIDVALP